MRGVIIAGVTLALLFASGVAAAGQPTTQATASVSASAAPAAAGVAAVGARPTVGDWGSMATDETRDGMPSEGDACEPVAGGEQRANPDGDQLGWEAGCWHDDALAVTYDDGLNETEFDAVIARAMARVEYIRQLEFERTVSVRFITPAAFRENIENRTESVSPAVRLHQNVKFEALFFVGEGTDGYAEFWGNIAGGTAGFYDPRTDDLVVVTNASENVTLDGLTREEENALAHELVHALQDQQFNLSRYNTSTRELHNANDGLVEGDASYVDHLYTQRCGSTWHCAPTTDEQRSPPTGFHWGIWLLTFQPYSDGPHFVERARERGGWEAVNDLYENPPASSEQVIHPERYPDDRPVTVTIRDRTSDGWHRLDIPGLDYIQLGEAGLFSMLFYPSLNDRRTRILNYRSFFNEDPLDRYDYSSEHTDGWEGDKLVPYVLENSTETNETGYVWKTVWESSADATDFADVYVELLVYHGAEPVPGRANTYRIPEGRPYADAFYVNRTGDVVVIVNAPTVDDLDGVRQGAAPRTPTPTSPTAAATDDPGGSNGGSPGPSTTTSPGFGAALAALVVLALALRHRRR